MQMNSNCIRIKLWLGFLRDSTAIHRHHKIRPFLLLSWVKTRISTTELVLGRLAGRDWGALILMFPLFQNHPPTKSLPSAPHVEHKILYFSLGVLRCIILNCSTVIWGWELWLRHDRWFQMKKWPGQCPLMTALLGGKQQFPFYC